MQPTEKNLLPRNVGVKLSGCPLIHLSEWRNGVELCQALFHSQELGRRGQDSLLAEAPPLASASCFHLSISCHKLDSSMASQQKNQKEGLWEQRTGQHLQLRGLDVSKHGIA